MIYINDEEPGEDLKTLFTRITRAGSITNQHAREYGTSVYICEEPVRSFNQFWLERTSEKNE
jgi:hypothetical protein